MKKDLFDELNIGIPKNVPNTALDADVENVRRLAGAKTASVLQKGKCGIMKSKKKFAIIAAAAVLTLGTAAFAGGEIVKNIFSRSSSIPDYVSLPTQERIAEDIGYEVLLIESFSNGYKFKDGGIVNSGFSDENGNISESFKSVDFRYEKNSDIVYFSQQKITAETEMTGKETAQADENGIYFSSYTNKLVPPGYELTEDDKNAEASGELVFSFGSSKVKTSEVCGAVWEKNGVRCELMQIDGKLTSDELCDMAKEAIDS